MNEVFELFAKLKLDSSDFDSGLSKARSMASSMASGLGGAFKTIAKVGSVAMGVATTAVSAFAKTAINAGLSFDTAMGEVAATAGKTAEELGDEIGSVDTAYGKFNGTLRDFAKFMGKNTAFSASQAAQALNYMALAGLNTQQSMEMLPKVLDMAAAGAMDLGRASDMITDISSAVGLSLAGVTDPQQLQEYSDRIELMVDEFAKAAATGNTTVEMLGDAFLTVGGLAKEVNGGFITLSDGSTAAVDNLQQLEIAFTAMANAGVKGSEAGTHMRNILLKLANPTDAGIKAFEQMGVSIYDMEGNMRPLNDLFRDMGAAMNQMSQAEKLSAIGDIFNARDTASAEALLAAVNQDWDRIGESILQAKGSASEMAKTKLANLQGDITKFKSALEGARIAISDGLTPSLRKFVQFGTESVSKLTTAFESGGMAGAVDEFANILEDALSKILDMAGPLVSAGAKLIKALVRGIVKNLPKIIEAVKEVAPDIFSFVAQTASDLLPIVTTSLGSLFSGAINFIVNSLPGMMPKIVAGLQKMMKNLVSKASQLIEILKEVAPVLIEAAVQLISTLAQGIAEALPTLIPAIVEAILFIAQELLSPQNLSVLLQAALDIIVNLAWGLVAAIPQLVNGISSVVLGIVNFLTAPDNIARIIGAALQLIIALATGLIEAIPTLIVQIPKIVASMFTSFVDAIFHTNWLELGWNIMKGIGNGLWEGLKSLGGVIVDIGKSIWNGFTGFFGIASPSKLMRDSVGKNIAYGLAEGLEEGTSEVQAAMDDMMGAASGAISGDVTARTSDFDVKHTGTIRIEGVNNQGEFVAASEYVIEEIITNIMKREARLA